jgi:hypothetical protein
MTGWQNVIELIRLAAFGAVVWLAWIGLRRLGQFYGADEMIDGLISQKGQRPRGPSDSPWAFDYKMGERARRRKADEEEAIRRARQRVSNQIVLPHEVKEFKRREG